MVGPAWPRIHEDIGCLDVPVHESRGMGRIEGRGHRRDNRSGAGAG